MRIHEICDTTVKPLPYDELAYKAKSFLKSRGLKKIAVVDEKNLRVIGVIRREKIIELPSTSSNTILLKDLLEEVKFYATLDDSAEVVIKEMFKYNEDCTPVIENDKSFTYAGILTMEAILDAVTKLGSENLNRLVKEIMIREVPHLKANDTLYNVWKKMKETKQSGLVIINDENKVVGVLTQHDLLASRISWLPLALKDDKGKHTLYVSDLMNKHVHTLNENVTVLEASKQMLKYRIGLMPVVNEEEKIVGVVNRRILVELLSDAL